MTTLPLILLVPSTTRRPPSTFTLESGPAAKSNMAPSSSSLFSCSSATFSRTWSNVTKSSISLPTSSAHTATLHSLHVVFWTTHFKQVGRHVGWTGRHTVHSLSFSMSSSWATTVRFLKRFLSISSSIASNWLFCCCLYNFLSLLAFKMSFNWFLMLSVLSSMVLLSSMSAVFSL